MCRCRRRYCRRRHGSVWLAQNTQQTGLRGLLNPLIFFVTTRRTFVRTFRARLTASGFTPLSITVFFADRPTAAVTALLVAFSLALVLFLVFTTTSRFGACLSTMSLLLLLSSPALFPLPAPAFLLGVCARVARGLSPPLLGLFVSSAIWTWGAEEAVSD